MPTRTSTGRRLVIVESPAKARTIQGYLGGGYDVEASIGHIRDLPSSAAEVPAAIKSQPWGRLAIDVADGFKPYYVVSAGKKAKVAELKRALSGADELLLATDEDREGEAIAWHLMEVLKPKVPVRRMVFHEITPDAIRSAAQDTRDLNRDLVDAQETRRLIDRLFGFEVSPVLWRKILSGLSAGRVQSVATRMVVARERDRIDFRSAGYWDIVGTFLAQEGEFQARLASVDGARVAGSADFTDAGELTQAAVRAGVLRLDQERAEQLAQGLSDARFRVQSVVEKPGTRRPSAPFMTSTLQQEASRKLRWGAQRTMRTAQSLYENGYITYMRTDSTTLSPSAIEAARDAARSIYGPEYVSERPRTYDRKVKNAQEAHEAIRPAGETFRRPVELRSVLSEDEHALYDLIWRRTVSCQMRDAVVATTTVRVAATASDGCQVVFTASGTVVVFAGFLAAYEESTDEERDRENGDDRASRKLPPLRADDDLIPSRMTPSGHSTQPPARYTEASLVKDLEERGIGRPSTYASIIATIIDRGYVRKRGAALVPTFLAFSVTRLMEEHFAVLVDYGFTARLEEILDQVAGASVDRLTVLRGFFYGDPEGRFPGLSSLVTGLSDIDARAVASFPIGQSGLTSSPVTGREDEIVLRVGKFGPYLERGEQRANVPDDLAPDELDLAMAEQLLAQPSGDRVLGTHPDSGLPIVAKAGRFGPYVTEVLAEDAPKKAKPRTASLLSGMSLETVTLTEAVRLLTLPRVVGTDPEGREITAANGRYGPFIARTVDGKPEYRSLPDEESLFSVTVEQALQLFAAPRTRRAAQPAAPLRELGPDPVSGGPITLREGRFGPYVTDGQTNASLRKGDDPVTLTAQRAIELIAERRAAGPPKKRTPAKREGTSGTSAAARPSRAATSKGATSRATATKGATSTGRAGRAGTSGSGETPRKPGGLSVAAFD